MWIYGRPRTKKRSAYKIEMDRLLAKRLTLEPGTSEYDHINQEIKDLQAQKTTNISNNRKFSPETRKTIGTAVCGISLMGINYWLENHSGMLSGRRSKDADTIMSTVLRSMTNMFRMGG